jgi:hypothetical protein
MSHSFPTRRSSDLNGDWHVVYEAIPAQRNNGRELNKHLDSNEYLGSTLHHSASSAFPVILPEVTPAPEQAEAA